jgi:PAP2 superfamily
MAQGVLEPQRVAVETVPRGSPWRTRVARIGREALLLGTMYAIYTVGRYVAASHSGPAFSNAEFVIDLESRLGLPSEVALQHDALSVPHLAQLANAYYAGVHFPLTFAVMLWLSIRRPAAYPRVRWAMIALTGLALIGHVLFPLAPPRMMTQFGWVDTGVRYGQSVYGANPDSGPANQFAAMPSLHVGWAVMVAIVLIMLTRSRLRWLWLLHPVVTVLVVVVTANHYWIDGIVSIVLLGCCLPIVTSDRSSYRPG